MRLPKSDHSNRAYESIERITPRTYFAYRSTAFWVSLAFIVGFGTFLGVMQAFFTKAFLYHMLFGDGADTGTLFVATQVRGAISLTLAVLFVIAFLRRSALARYAVHFATCFVAFNLVMDLARLALAEDWLMMMSSSAYLVVRPFMLGALLTMAVSMSETARFERKHVPPGAVLYEHRKT